MLSKFKTAILATSLISGAIGLANSRAFDLVSLAWKKWEPQAVAEFRLRAIPPADYIVAINESIEEEDFEEAQALVELAKENGIVLPDEIVEQTEEGYLSFGLRQGRDFVWNGFLKGETTNLTSFSGAVISDFLVIGDVRDLSIETKNYLAGNDYSKLTLAFSSVGVAGSLGSFATLGAAAPFDIGLGLIKNLNKAQKATRKSKLFSKPMNSRLTREFTDAASEMIDTRTLSNIVKSDISFSPRMPSLSSIKEAVSVESMRKALSGNFSTLKKLADDALPSDLPKIQKELSSAINVKAIDKIRDQTTAVGEVYQAGGLAASVRVMQLADDAKDLRKFANLSKKFGKKTSGVIRILGKNAIKLGKLLYGFISVVAGLLIWLAGFVWFAGGLLRRLFFATRAA